jgi:hypothetical protein
MFRRLDSVSSGGTYLGPVDGASPYLGTADGDKIQYPKLCVSNKKQDNAIKSVQIHFETGS